MEGVVHPHDSAPVCKSKKAVDVVRDCVHFEETSHLSYIQ
jgi:hypothetical protein